MDRLPTLIAVVAVVGCTESGSKSRSKSDARVAAVEAAKAEDPAEVAAKWCDVMPDASEAKAFSYPGLADGAGARGKARWVNVWATWCKPCIEELPRIRSFRERLGEDGAALQLELLAADEADPLKSFAQEHEAARGSLRLEDPDSVAAWLEQLGLESSGTGLPLHMFVDANDTLRCARLGGVGDDDYASVLAVARSL